MKWWPFVWKSEYDRLGNSLSKAWSIVQEKNKACKEDREAVEILTGQKVRLSKEKVALEDEIATLRDELRKNSSLTSDWQHAVALEVKAGDEARAELAKVQKENQVIRTAMRGLEAANAEQSKAMADLRDKLELEARAASYNGDSAGEFFVECKRLDSELSEAKAVKENLEAALSAANEEIESRDVRLTENGVLLGNLKFKIEEWRKDGRMKTQHINKCRDELDMIKSTVEKSIEFISEVVLGNLVAECDL